MHTLIRKLKGGDQRSIGRANEVVKAVLKSPDFLPLVVDALDEDDPVVAMRAADALEKISRERPELLTPHGRTLITRAQRSGQAAVRWNLAETIPRLSLDGRQRERVFKLLEKFLYDDGRLVRTAAMQGLADLAKRDSRFLGRVRPLIAWHTANGSPAMKARGQRLMRQLDLIGIDALVER